MHKKILLISTVLLSSFSVASEDDSPTPITELTVFVAKQIITMDASIPEATAVAVANGRIVSVGDLKTLSPWIERYETHIDDTFKDKVILPGFIDPHVHPSLPAILSAFPFIAPEEWDIPTGNFPPAANPQEYVSTLKRRVEEHVESPDFDPGVPFVTWGFHQLWHGEVYRPKLDELFPDIPVVLWHRSFHELIANTAALDLLGVSEEESNNHPQEIDWEKGLFSEYGAKVVFLPKLMPKILTPERYATGMGNFIEMMHLGGITSAMDMGVGVFGDAEGEIEMIKKAMQGAPARIVLTPIITDFIARNVGPDEALKQVRLWEQDATDNVKLDGHFKLMMDGAAFSGLGQMNFPGYIDGHQGVWMSPLDTTYAYAKTFWNAGYQLHAHTNGDLSTDKLIGMISMLQQQYPRKDHRAVLEHFMFAHEDQLRRMSDLGMAVSANPYYQFILADTYAENWLGEDRARNIAPLGTAIRAGVPLALHSDAPMAPLSPLTLVEVAVNRVTINGNPNNQSEAISVDEALRGVTIDAAWMMRMEDSIGSIRAGKKADFTVLEQSPFEVDAEDISEIELWGTVFAGEKNPLQ